MQYLQNIYKICMHAYLIFVIFGTPPHYLGLTNMRYVCMLTKPWQNANIQKIFKCMYCYKIFTKYMASARHHVRLSHVFYEIWKCISHITAATKIQISNINLNFSASDLNKHLLIGVWSGLKRICNYLVVQLFLSSVRWSRNQSGLTFW